MSMMRLQAASLLLAAMLPATVQAGDVLTIGVLAPDTGPMRSVGRQIVVGAEIGVESLKSLIDVPKVELEIFREDFGSYSLPRITNLLKAKGVGAVIGGATPATARNVAAAAEKWGLPTILIADPGTWRARGIADNILQLGLSRAEVYRINLWHWIRDSGIKKVSVLYDAGHKLTSKYGAEMAPMTFHSLKNIPAFQKVSFSGSQMSEYYEKVRTIKNYAPMGIVVSGLPWDTANLVNAFAKEGFVTPIYVAPPVDAVIAIEDLAKRGKMPIYYGTQFWPNPTDPKAQSFMKKVREKLGWSAEGAVSTIAVRAYDAVQVVRTTWAGNDDWVNDSRPWGKITAVDGIVGKLTKLELSKGHTMAGPMGLMVGYPDGTLEFRSTKYVPIPNE